MNNTENDYLPTDLGNVSLNPRGEYDPETAYEYLDTVSYQGGSYVCRIENGTTITGTHPDPGHNTDLWQMLTLPGNLTPDYIAMHDDVINKAIQAEASRAAAEEAQDRAEAAQADVTQMRTDTLRAATEAAESRDSAAGYAQSAEQSRKAVAESEQNINAQVTGFDEKVSESVTQARAEIDNARQQAIRVVTNQQDTSAEEVKKVGNAVLGAANQALQEIKNTGQQAVKAVTNQGTTSVQAVKDETEKYVIEKKQEITVKAEEAIQVVTKMGEKQLQDIADSLDPALTAEGKAADAAAVGKAIESVKESKADKNALVTTNRKLDALWKLNQGISYQFEEDSKTAYQKDVPSGAKMVNIKKIGGRTIGWNQIANKLQGTYTCNGITYTHNNDGTVIADGTATADSYSQTLYDFLRGRQECKYLIKGCPYDGNIDTYHITGKYIVGNKDIGKGIIFLDYKEATEYTDFIAITIKSGVTVNNVVFKPQIFNMTKMFGKGNEPSTVEEFETIFTGDYYPYNKGELMNTPVNNVIVQVREKKQISLSIPQEIIDLPEYGRSAGEVYNEIDWEKKQYIQRVGSVDLGNLNFTTEEYENHKYFKTADIAKQIKPNTTNTISARYTHASSNSVTEQRNLENIVDTKGQLYLKDDSVKQDPVLLKAALNGVFLYYEFAEPIVTDIAERIPEGFLEAMEVEAGGSLTFQNSNGDGYKVPVPNTVEYAVKLSEVTE